MPTVFSSRDRREQFPAHSCNLENADADSLFYGITEGLMSRCPEFGCTFSVGHSTLRPQHARATGAALASGSTSGGFQDGHPGLRVQHGSSLSGRRLSVGLRRRSSSAAFCHIKDVCCETNLQQLWRQVFCSCRSEAVELPSIWSETSWH